MTTGEVIALARECGLHFGGSPMEPGLERFARLIAERATAAECARWKAAIGPQVPADFKDWHENADSELPSIAAWMIENTRKHRDKAEVALRSVIRSRSNT